MRKQIPSGKEVLEPLNFFPLLTILFISNPTFNIMKETKAAFLPGKLKINEKCSDENNFHRIINHIFFCHCKMC